MRIEEPGVVRVSYVRPPCDAEVSGRAVRSVRRIRGDGTPRLHVASASPSGDPARVHLDFRRHSDSGPASQPRPARRAQQDAAPFDRPVLPPSFRFQ